MALEAHHQELPEVEQTILTMTVSAELNTLDWKERCEQLEYEHQLDLERVRLHYDRELKEKAIEIRKQLKREYEEQIAELQTRLLEQQQLAAVRSPSSINLDRSFGEKVREQVRLAEELDRRDEAQREKILSPSNLDSEELKRLINKLHTEGIHVLTLSELLSLQLNGINIDRNGCSADFTEKLREENSLLRSLIANINQKESSTRLIQCLAEIFRCERERRLTEVRQHRNVDHLEEEIEMMCDYQRNALNKFLSEDRLMLIEELQNTKNELEQLKDIFDSLKSQQKSNVSVNSKQLNQFYFKYLRCEAHRKALVYQKRYLLILLTGYQDTETFALNEIRRLTGNSKWNSDYFDDRQSTKFVHRHHRKLVNYRFRFRSYVRLVIAVLRLRWLVKKWAQKQTSLV